VELLDEEEGEEWRGMGALNRPKMMGHHKPRRSDSLPAG
jgi:hypothetical protein